MVERSILGFHQGNTADRCINLVVEPVQLEDYVHVSFFQRLAKLPGFGYSDSVGHHRHPPDLGPSRDVDQFREPGVHSRFTATQRDRLERSFMLYEPIHDPLKIVWRHVGAMLVVDNTDRALQVTVVSDLDDGQTRVLLMGRAQTTVGRAALLDLGREAERLASGLRKTKGVAKVCRILIDKRLAMTVFRAILVEIDPVVLENHPSLNEVKTIRTG